MNAKEKKELEDFCKTHEMLAGFLESIGMRTHADDVRKSIKFIRRAIRGKK